MPPALVKAHQQLDKAVDGCYRPQPFANETKRIEYLFELYDRYTSGMFVGGEEGEGERKIKDLIRLHLSLPRDNSQMRYT